MSWIVTGRDRKLGKLYWQGVVPGPLSLCIYVSTEPRRAARFETREDAATAFRAVSPNITNYTLEEVPDQGLTPQRPSHPVKAGQLDLFADSWASI
jgi:hypothetical protein